MNMARIRFYRMAEALARRGHEVDIVTNLAPEPRFRAPRLREVPFKFARWERYDVVKTFFHKGFESLLAEGGGDHPFIVSKLGSVVGSEQTPGVYFFGKEREQLFETQKEIARRSRIVTVLTNPSAALWWKEHSRGVPLYMVPTGVDAEIPAPRGNPYSSIGVEGPVALFTGHLYKRDAQREVNLIWQERLNRLGRALRSSGIRLVAMGSGATDTLDPSAVIHLGEIDADQVWDFQRHASAGIVLAQGPIQDNESSKIYYYLRTGLPVVCERGVPNAWLIEETGLGTIVDYDNVEHFAQAVARVAREMPKDEQVGEYMAREHSWDARAALYDCAFATLAQRSSGSPQSAGPGAVREAGRAQQSHRIAYAAQSAPAVYFPEWYATDNEFSDPSELAEAHAPIVKLALQVMDDRAGRVIDLGCGNGALLQKIHRGNDRIVPFGVDIRQGRIDHAHLLLPSFRENFRCGNIFDNDWIWAGDRRYALVIVTAARLFETGPEAAARLRKRLAERCENLLVYAYTKRFGTLQEAAPRVGLRLVFSEGKVGLAVVES